MTTSLHALWHSLAGKYALLVGALIVAAGAALGATSYVAFEDSRRSEEIGVVRLGVSLVEVNDELAAMQRKLFEIAIGFVVFALLGTFVLLHRTGLRLNRLRGSAQAAASGRFDMRVDDEGEPEVRELAEAFNTMLDAISEKTEKIHRLAYFDALTGAANRSRFQEKLNGGLAACDASNAQLAAMFFDLDRFKQINDKLGHAVGDDVLCGFYKTIEAARPTDRDDQWSIVARLGGDEFTMLIVGQDVRETASRVAENILLALRDPMPAGDQTLTIGTSIGIACYPEDAASKKELMQAADLAMYAAKEAGRNTFRTFTDVMRHGPMDRFSLESQLRESIENGGFELHYQPIVSLETFGPTGMEALLCWRHPNGHLAAPDAFLAVAEESGLILPIGLWVMMEACAQATRWRQHFKRPLPVSVNISARQFEQSDLVELLLKLVQEERGLADWPTLEITESVAMNQAETTLKTLAPLRSRGVRIAIDDFGTGYSSLSCLQDFPIDVLKIDKSFVADLVKVQTTDSDDPHGPGAVPSHANIVDHRRQMIIEAIVQMAHALDYRIVAEGIETEAQRDPLRRIGCEFGQGFLFGRPMSTSDATGRLDEKMPIQHKALL